MGSTAGALALVAPVLVFWFGLFLPYSRAVPTTGLSRDLYAYFYPRYTYAADALWSGTLPLWNPWELGGVPFLASAQTGLLNPFVALLFGMLPPALALHAFFLVHYVLAGALVALLCRRLGMTPAAGRLAGVAWMLSPALTRSVYHPNRIACLVWLPLVFLLGARCAGTGARTGAGALLALVLAVQVAAGYPEFALDGGVLLGLAALAGLRLPDGAPRVSRGRHLLRLSAAAGLAVALAGVQLLPTLEALDASARAATAARPVLAPGPEVLATLLGLRPEVGHVYLGMLPAFFVGVVPLLLAGVGVLFGERGVARPFLVGAVACVLAVVGYEYVHALPIYRSTRFALPWALLFPFFTAVLAGLGWDAIVTTRARGAVLPVALGAIAFLAVGQPITGVTAAVAAVLVGVALLAPRRGRLVPGMLGVVVVMDLLAATPYRAGTDPMPPLVRSETTRTLVALLRSHPEPVRFLGPVEAFAGVALAERVQSVAGLEESLMPRPLRRLVDYFGLGVGVARMRLRTENVVRSRPLLDLLGVAYVTGPLAWQDGLLEAGFETVVLPRGDAHGLWRNTHVLSRAFLVRGVREVVDSREAFAAVRASEFSPRSEAVVQTGALPQLPTAGPIGAHEGARILVYEPERVRIEAVAERPALLVLADADYPGWEATIDGAPTAIVRADFAFRGVLVPAGRHRVEFVYRPRSVRAGLALTASGFLGLLAALALAARRGAW